MRYVIKLAHSHEFYTLFAVKHKVVCQSMKIHPERNVKMHTFEDLGLMQLFTEQDLVSTIIRARPCSEEFIRKFYANLELKINDPTSISIIGFMLGGGFFFSPGAINCLYVSDYDEDEESPDLPNMDVIVGTITCGKFDK